MIIECNTAFAMQVIGIPSIRHAAVPKISRDAFVSVSTPLRTDVLTSMLQKVFQSTLLPSNQANQVQIVHLALLNLAKTQGEQAGVRGCLRFSCECQEIGQEAMGRNSCTESSTWTVMKLSLPGSPTLFTCADVISCCHQAQICSGRGCWQWMTVLRRAGCSGQPWSLLAWSWACRMCRCKAFFHPEPKPR